MPTPTTLQLNWNPVAFTPSGGSSTPIPRVSSVSFDAGGSLLEYAGDGNRFPVAQVLAMSRPSATVESQHVGALTAFTIGTKGTLVATLLDAINLGVTGGGALLFTLNNACIENIPVGGRFGSFASGTVNFKAFSTDGVTSPLVIAAV